MRDLLSNILLALQTRCTERDLREPLPRSDFGRNYAAMACNRQAPPTSGVRPPLTFKL